LSLLLHFILELFSIVSLHFSFFPCLIFSFIFCLLPSSFFLLPSFLLFFSIDFFTHPLLWYFNPLSFGSIYLPAQRDVALKVIDVLELENQDDDISDIQNEILVLARCDHPNITKYYGSFVRGCKLWICMEYLGGGSARDMVLFLLLLNSFHSFILFPSKTMIIINKNVA